MENRNWLKKHVDTIVILASFASSVLWMNGKFNDVDKRFMLMEKEMMYIQKEMAVIKTVLLMKNILPSELAQGNENADHS